MSTHKKCGVDGLKPAPAAISEGDYPLDRFFFSTKRLAAETWRAAFSLGVGGGRVCGRAWGGRGGAQIWPMLAMEGIQSPKEDVTGAGKGNSGWLTRIAKGQIAAGSFVLKRGGEAGQRYPISTSSPAGGAELIAGGGPAHPPAALAPTIRVVTDFRPVGCGRAW